MKLREPVTWVTLQGVKRGFVVLVRKNLFKTSTSGILRTHREHVDWIRGHHEATSPQAVALLAANALATRSR